MFQKKPCVCGIKVPNYITGQHSQSNDRIQGSYSNRAPGSSTSGKETMFLSETYTTESRVCATGVTVNMVAASPIGGAQGLTAKANCGGLKECDNQGSNLGKK
jgi:hypothetical protein